MDMIFQAGCINGLELPNRLVRSATWEGMAADDGAVTSRLIDTMIDLVRGGVGLIISSHAYVAQVGKASPWQVGIDKDEWLPGLESMAAAVHDAGGKMVMQLAHAGVLTTLELAGGTPWAVSDFPELGAMPRRELTPEDILNLPAVFAEAARRAQKAGFDGIQVHAAHGYLLSQFLSPVFNHRRDEFGGHIENRGRIHLAVIRAIRDMVGPDFPILIKINGQDYAENGLTLEDAVKVAKWLVQAGVDAIEVSGGLLINKDMSASRPKINTPEKEAYFKEDARAIKKEITVPLILVGGMRSIEVAEKLLEENTADFIAMSRPLIREPGLVNRWKGGDRSPAACISDNLCFKPGLRGKGIYCLTEEWQRRRQDGRDPSQPSS